VEWEFIDTFVIDDAREIWAGSTGTSKGLIFGIHAGLAAAKVCVTNASEM